MKFVITVAALLGFAAQVTFACQICVPFPTKSAADYLIESDTVVLAREDPERPFHYATIKVLKGDPGEKPIDLFLDSATRRSLAAYPERAVVLTGKSKDAVTAWKRVAMTDDQVAPVVREILALAPLWADRPRARIEYFGKRLGHDNAQLRSLAHLEVGRAPYSEIKRLGGALSREEIHRFLANFRYMEWHALYILLLAQSEEAADRALIESSLRSASRFKATIRLAAWATAFIEHREEEALAYIESEYFAAGSQRSRAELVEISKALSVHGGSGHTHLRDRIVASYGKLLARDSSLTPAIAADLIAWKRTELADEIEAYATANPREFDFQQTMQLRAYVRGAKLGLR